MLIIVRQVLEPLNDLLEDNIAFVMLLHFTAVRDINAELFAEELGDVLVDLFDASRRIIATSSNPVKQYVSLITIMSARFILGKWKMIHILPMAAFLGHIGKTAHRLVLVLFPIVGWRKRIV